MTGTVENYLTTAISEMLEVCTNELGFELPVCVASVSKNGYALTLRAHRDGSSPADILAETQVPPEAGAALPINIMVVDSTGTKAAHFVIEGPTAPRLRLVH